MYVYVHTCTYYVAGHARSAYKHIDFIELIAIQC